MNRSPWLSSLEQKRPFFQNTRNRSRDVVIIGGGIAGLSTAFFLLKHTRRHVTLVEAGKIAHGATGHNAGQIVSYFERSLHDLFTTYGAERARESVLAIENAWDLLSEIESSIQPKTVIERFVGYAGICDRATFFSFLETGRLRRAQNLPEQPLYVAEEAVDELHLSEDQAEHVTVVPQTQLLRLLEINDSAYFAVHAEQKGCTNSAALTEEIAQYLFRQNARRFTLIEQFPIERVTLEQDILRVSSGRYELTAKDVILCTNGFEQLAIDGPAHVNERFHKELSGVIGYMMAYDIPRAPSGSWSFLNQTSQCNSFDCSLDPYPYLTRRKHTQDRSLICIGGPEKDLPEQKTYHRESQFPKSEKKRLLEIKRRLRPHDHLGDTPYFWHGLMGYTRNMLRLIGPDPSYPSLWYNLGCNGIGILPSIYGGFKLSQLLNGAAYPPSLFDPFFESTQEKPQQTKGAKRNAVPPKPTERTRANKPQKPTNHPKRDQKSDRASRKQRR